MTSIPQRFRNIDGTLDSLIAQEQSADSYYVWICRRYRRTHDTIPVAELERKRRRYPMVQFCFSEDFGPLTKLRPTLATETEPHTLIVTADDEQTYDSWWLRGLLDSSMSSGNGVVGYRGRRFRRRAFARNLNYLESILYENVRFWRRPVDVLTGVAGAAYQRHMFGRDFCEQWDRFTDQDLPELFTNDDVWINAYLGTKRIRRYVTPVWSRQRLHGGGAEALTHVNWAVSEGSKGQDRSTYLIAELSRKGWCV